MRILFIAHGLGFGGASESLFILIRSILRYGCKVEIIVPYIENNNAKLRFLNLGVNIVEIDCGQFHSNQAGHTSLFRIPFEYLKFKINITKIINHIKLRNFDIVHINSSVLAHLLKPIKKINNNIKTVIHVRELLSINFDYTFIGYSIIHNINKWADHIICISENESKNLNPSDKISICYNPFEFENLNTTSIFEKKMPSDKYKVLMMGQFHESKGQIDFLRAISIFIEKFPILSSNCSFTILGYSDKKNKNYYQKIKSILIKSYKEKFFEELLSLKLEERVELIPYKENIYPELSSASVVIRPSKSGDPWGRDIIESMAHGKAIIATGTYSRFVKPGYNGELVSPSQPSEIAQALQLIIPNLIISYGNNSYELAKQLFDTDDYVKKIIFIYRKLKNGNTI